MMKRLSIGLILGMCCCGVVGAQSFAPAFGRSGYRSALPAKSYAPMARSVAVPLPARQPGQPVSYSGLSVPMAGGQGSYSKGVSSLRKPLELGYTAAAEYIAGGGSVMPVRRGAPPTSGSAFDRWMQSGGSAALDYEIDGVGYYDMNRLYELWLQYAADNDMPGTWDAFMDWFNNGNQNKYRAPLDGTFWCLTLLAGLYVGVETIKRKRL